tara:strand:+ start:300 stop:476 length:177 start_codon:yes stop_codon:yes gene_type:complete
LVPNQAIQQFQYSSITKKEINNAWKDVKKEAKGKNPFTAGRVKEAFNAYKADIKRMKP